MSPNKTTVQKTKTCSHERPEIDPKVQRRYVFIWSDGAKNCIKEIMAEVNPAIIIPMIINAVVEFNLDEKYNSSKVAIKAPKNEAKHRNQEFVTKGKNPAAADKKITLATPKPDADVIPNTEGSANGFLNNSCNKNPLTESETPANKAAIALGNL